MDGADREHSIFTGSSTGLCWAKCCRNRQGKLVSQLESRAARRDRKKRTGWEEERNAGRKSQNSSLLPPTLSVSLSPNGIPWRQSLTQESQKRDWRSHGRNSPKCDWQAPSRLEGTSGAKVPGWCREPSAYPQVRALLRGLDTQYDCIGLCVRKQKVHTHSENPSGFLPTRKYLLPTACTKL